MWDFTKGVDASKLNDGLWTTDNVTGITTTTGLVASDESKHFTYKDYGLTEYPLYLNTYHQNSGNDSEGRVSDISVNEPTSLTDVPGMTAIPGKDTNLPSENGGKTYKGIKLHGKASFMKIDGILDGMNIIMHMGNANSGKVQDASGASSSGLHVFPNNYKDPQDPDGTMYNLNRLTNVFTYTPGGEGYKAVEPEGNVVITNIVAGYPAATGLLNTGNGAKPSSDGKTVTRTAGYATMISPYNIDMSGQKAVKAYICTYYGYANNQVHMKQIRHIPANTPVMLKGYARDMSVLYISEGNKPVDHGIDQSVFEQNRLVGALTPTMVNTTD